ncbi:hypothetical protein [Streptomyces glaucus]|uniref:Uncharacterized protein n=1 Tax=Streptomyces glaucus TaxID=284029 RepID=A0ABP5WTJ1_9ACTN
MISGTRLDGSGLDHAPDIVVKASVADRCRQLVLTHGELSAQPREACGAEVSETTISTVTGRAVDGMHEGRNRPLDAVHPVPFADCVQGRPRVPPTIS